MITCLLTSHNRPNELRRAVDSVVTQTYTDWELLVLDSGELKPTFDHPQIEVHLTNETPMVREHKWAPSVALNQAIPLIKGDLVCQLCDDDIYYPNAFATFAGIKQDQHAVYASIERQGQPTIMAWEVCGLGSPHRMDNRIDGMQMCFRRQLLDTFLDENPWPEEQQHRSHADGIFMDRIGNRCLVWPIPTIVGKKL